MNDRQREALKLLKKYPERWISPKGFGMSWQSFEYLYRQGLAIKKDSTRELPVYYKIK